MIVNGLYIPNLFQIVLFLFSICAFCTVACAIWESMIGQYFQVIITYIYFCYIMFSNVKSIEKKTLLYISCIFISGILNQNIVSYKVS